MVGRQNKCFLLLSSLCNFILLDMVNLPGRWGKVMKLLNTMWSCTLRTGLTSVNSPLLLLQSGLFVTEAGGCQGVSKLGELTKIDSFYLHQPGKKIALNLIWEVIPIFCCYNLCCKSSAIWGPFWISSSWSQTIWGESLLSLKRDKKRNWASWLSIKSRKYLALAASTNPAELWCSGSPFLWYLRDYRHYS